MSNKSVLFVDDDAQLVEVLARHARSLDLEVFTAHNALTALNLIERESPDLICLDVEMPTANGLSIGEMISKTSGQTALVVLTGLKDEATRQRAAKFGARFLTKGKDTWPRLKEVISDLLELESETRDDPSDQSSDISDLVFAMLGTSESLLESAACIEQEPTHEEAEPQATQQPWVLCVEDDRDFSLALQLHLGRHNISVVRAFEGVEGLQTALARPAEAIILDYNLPNGRGDYVLRRLKANPFTREIPVIVVSGQKRPGLEKEMLHLGAVRFFAKPVRFDELLEEIQQQIAVAVEAE